jgi:hypothetical protein
MFGGNNNVYEVRPYDAGNSSNESNLNAVNKLIELDYVKVNPEYNTTGNFTKEMFDTLSTTVKRITLPDTSISLQKNRDIGYGQGIVVEVNDKDLNGALIGQVILVPEPE